MMDVGILVKLSRRWEHRRHVAHPAGRRPRPMAILTTTLSQEISLSLTDTLLFSEAIQGSGGAIATSRYRR